MSCLPTYKEKRYNSLEELYKDVNQKTTQQEQVKKFVELQERLNNKEFIEGAKNAYESTPALQQYGTQAQYNDYIARVSLGIIKNPSSGEYNYESAVKDIVYHGTDTKFDKFNTIRPNGMFVTSFTTDFKTANEYTKRNEVGKEYRVISAILNIDNPKYVDYVEASFIKNKPTQYDAYIDPTNDGLNHDEYIVFEPEQIHILSSKADIQGFKDFMSFENSEFSKYGTYQQFRDFITSKFSIEIENRLIETGKINRVC